MKFDSTSKILGKGLKIKELDEKTQLRRLGEIKLPLCLCASVPLPLCLLASLPLCFAEPGSSCAPVRLCLSASFHGKCRQAQGQRDTEAQRQRGTDAQRKPD